MVFGEHVLQQSVSLQALKQIKSQDTGTHETERQGKKDLYDDPR